jgi:hypothetical protein
MILSYQVNPGKKGYKDEDGHGIAECHQENREEVAPEVAFLTSAAPVLLYRVGVKDLGPDEKNEQAPDQLENKAVIFDKIDHKTNPKDGNEGKHHVGSGCSRARNKT